MALEVNFGIGASDMTGHLVNQEDKYNDSFSHPSCLSLLLPKVVLGSELFLMCFERVRCTLTCFVHIQCDVADNIECPRRPLSQNIRLKLLLLPLQKLNFSRLPSSFHTFDISHSTRSTQLINNYHSFTVSMAAARAFRLAMLFVLIALTSTIYGSPIVTREDSVCAPSLTGYKPLANVTVDHLRDHFIFTSYFQPRYRQLRFPPGGQHLLDRDSALRICRRAAS